MNSVFEFYGPNLLVLLPKLLCFPLYINKKIFYRLQIHAEEIQSSKFDTHPFSGPPDHCQNFTHGSAAVASEVALAVAMVKIGLIPRWINCEAIYYNQNDKALSKIRAYFIGGA